MTLIRQTKQKLIIQNFVNRYKWLYYNKTILFGKLLLCLLSVNYIDTVVASASQTHGSEGECILGMAMHATPTYLSNYVNLTQDDLKNGRIEVNPETLTAVITLPSTTTIYNFFKQGDPITDCQQIVKGTYVYEYISNHSGYSPSSDVIGENSTIYFGLTPIKSLDRYSLALFKYEVTSTNPALTLKFDNSDGKFSKKLKSVVICSELSATNPAQNALSIVGTCNVALTEGLIIAKSAILHASTDTAKGCAGLNINHNAGITLNADIINYGEISGFYGVKINDTGALTTGRNYKFCVSNPDGGKIARFFNHGYIEGSPTAFEIMGETHEKVDTFELTNEEHAYIEGKLNLIKTNSLQHTVDFNVINYGVIAATATATAIDITEYTGKSESRLWLKFDGNSINGPIARFSGEMNLEEDAKILLTAEASFTQKDFIIAEANNIELDENLVDHLFTKVSSATACFIEAGSIELTDKHIKADLEAKKFNGNIPQSKYMPDIFRIVNAEKNILNAINIATGVDEIINKNIEIAGITVDDSLIEKFKRSKDLFKIAKNNYSTKEEFFDALLPDSSNSQIISHHKIATKITDQITARLHSRAMAAVKSGTAHKGITSGDLARNMGVWTDINYLQNKDKKNDKKQSYSELKALVLSIGADSLLSSCDITLGLSYGFSSSSVNIYGGFSGINLDNFPQTPSSEDLKTHIFSLYSAIPIKQVDAQFAFSFGVTRHQQKDLPIAEIEHKDFYNSNFINFNSAATYPLDVDLFNLNLTSSLNANFINIEKYFNKYELFTAKNSRTLVTLGIMLDINDIVEINDDISLDYKVGLSGKYTMSNDDKYTITIAKNYSIKYNKRTVSPFDFSVSSNLNFQIKTVVHLGIDFNFGLGRDSNEYGVATSVRYMF